MASVTKVMTALLVPGSQRPLGQEIQVPKAAFHLRLEERR